MSSTAEQYSWQPYEKCNKESKTTVKVDFSKITSSEPYVTPEKIHLKQDLSEAFNLEVHYTRQNTYDYYSDYDTWIMNISLIFDNELHVISSDYVYVIDVEILSTPKNEKCFYYTLKQQRTSAKLMFTKELNYHCYNGMSAEICLTISRYNTTEKLEKCPCNCTISEILLRNGTYSDVSLTVEKKEFSVHKAILSLKSDVFEKMFAREMLENQNGKVLIKDFDAKVIAEMIFYIYTCRNQYINECYIELFKAAHKYNVDGLISKCEEYMMMNMNLENIVDILYLSDLYQRRELRKKAQVFVKRYESVLVETESYQEYICRNFEIMTVASTLLFCEKYEMLNVKSKALEFIKINKKDISKNPTCFDTLESAKLLREVLMYIES